jgi:hypothetical protein
MARSILDPDQRRVDAGIAEAFLGGVGLFLLRTDRRGPDTVRPLLALGQLAFHAEHRQRARCCPAFSVRRTRPPDV